MGAPSAIGGKVRHAGVATESNRNVTIYTTKYARAGITVERLRQLATKSAKPASLYGFDCLWQYTKVSELQHLSRNSRLNR